MRVLQTWLLGILVWAGTDSAWATFINPLGGGSGRELSLQTILDQRRSTAGTVPFDVDDHQRLDDTLWEFSGGRSWATVVIEIASYADGNRFGLYDPLDPTRRVEVFNGAATGGSRTEIELTPTARGYEVRINGLYRQTFGSDDFGFYLTSKVNRTFFSDPALNPDVFPRPPNKNEPVDHLVSYTGRAGQTLQVGNQALSWGAQDAVLAWEDLFNGGDRDYNDLVLLVQNVHPRDPDPVTVPEGGSSVVLLAIGLAVVCGIRRARP